jgi:hypothetical protein
MNNVTEVSVENLVRALGKEKKVKFLKRDWITATDSKGDKYRFKTWEKTLEFINNYDSDATDIISPCCAFGSDGSENVTVKMCDCPSKRQIGKRTIETSFNSGEEIEVATCIYRSIFSGGFPTCGHYQGTMKVKRPDEQFGFMRDQYKVLCTSQRNT